MDPTAPPTTAQDTAQFSDFTSEPDIFHDDMTSPPPTISPYASTTPPVQDHVPVSLRLPRHLKPEHYNIEITPWIYSGSVHVFYFNGTSEMFLYCEEDTDVITFHSKPGLSIDSGNITVTDTSNGSIVDVNQTEYDYEREFYVIYLNTPLTRGQRVSVAVTYTGGLYDSLAGLYWSDYLDSNGITK